jgi:hypothetical protein
MCLKNLFLIILSFSISVCFAQSKFELRIGGGAGLNYKGNLNFADAKYGVYAKSLAAPTYIFNIGAAYNLNKRFNITLYHNRGPSSIRVEHTAKLTDNSLFVLPQGWQFSKDRLQLSSAFPNRDYELGFEYKVINRKLGLVLSAAISYRRWIYAYNSYILLVNTTFDTPDTYYYFKAEYSNTNQIRGAVYSALGISSRYTISKHHSVILGIKNYIGIYNKYIDGMYTILVKPGDIRQGYTKASRDLISLQLQYAYTF